MKKSYFNLLGPKYFLLLVFISSCSGGGSSEIKTPEISDLNINLIGLKTPSRSYEYQDIQITSNIAECSFNISLDNQDFYKIHHVKTNNNKNFVFRNPLIYSETENFQFKITTIENFNCPNVEKIYNLHVDRYPTQYQLIPTNTNDLKTNIYQIGDIGFGGIIINDTFTATICYPTPNDCEVFENSLFGQDAHNMVQGDFNGDGYEDFAVAWAFFPHTIEPSQKVNAPINIFLNNGEGRFEENTDIYLNGEAPRHPFAYRTIAADFNNDGIDDIFSGSMGIQYRSEDYSENFINPYPHLLFLSNADGKFEDKSGQIEDQNNGNGQLCGFAHDASVGDPDADGDIDIFACNILNINDGEGNFIMHDFINLDWQRQNQYGNPMSSVMTDLNNDSFDDIIFWNFDNRSNWSSADEGYILLSDNSSNIENWTKIPVPVGPFGYDRNKYNHAVAGDINNDGFTDIVVAVTRDLPYYEGAYIQILINNGLGELIDMTESNFPSQARSDSHHGEGNIYLRDMNLDGSLDIIHSTRDYSSGHHGAHIAINDGMGNFVSIDNSRLPNKPDPGFNNYDFLMKALPINADDESCLDFISVTDAGWENSGEIETSNYFFTVLNTNCSF
tara:strand:+ start:1138 stop:2985 length:1848 start_codon:yes stop_codon:yes gene_type:complete